MDAEQLLNIALSPRRPQKSVTSQSNQSDQTNKDSWPSPVSEGFHFQSRNAPIQWRKLCGLNVDRIRQQVNVDALQDVLEMITFCDIEREDMGQLDPNFVKLFQLSQLMLEYLLYSQTRLVEERQKAIQERDHVVAREQKLLKQWKQSETKSDTVGHENRQLKKAVHAFQLWSKIPGGLNQNTGASTYHRCLYCTKVFTSETFLRGHLVRRHPEHAAAEDRENVPPQPQPQQDVIVHLMSTVERLTGQLWQTETKMREQFQQQMDKEIHSRESLLLERSRSERDAIQKELSEWKQRVSTQMEEERAWLKEERAELEKLKKQSKLSHLGPLENDPHLDESMLKRLESRYDAAMEKLTDLITRALNTKADGAKPDNSRNLAMERKAIEDEMNATMRKISTLEDRLRLRPTGDDLPLDKWPIYLQMMREFKYTPIPEYPGIRSKYPQSQFMIEQKKAEMNIWLENEFQRYFDPTKPIDQEKFKKIQEQMYEARQQKSAEWLKMRAFLNGELESLTQAMFKMKPLQPTNQIIQTSNIQLPNIQLPDKNEFFRQYRLADDLNASMNSERSGRESAADWATEKSSDSDSMSDITDEFDIGSEPSTVASVSTSPAKPKLKETFQKAFSGFFKNSDKNEISERIQRDTQEQRNQQQPVMDEGKLVLDPALQNAVGGVQETKAKNIPLENDNLINDLEIADLSKVMEAPPGNKVEVKDDLAAVLQEINSEMGPAKNEPVRRINIASSLDDF